MSPTGLCSTAGASPACASSCVAPNPDLCGSKCVNKTTDPTNCGTCGHDCTALAHVTNASAVSCNSAGGCVIPQSACGAGYANCSSTSNDLDGCETQTNTNTNCGGCGVTCSITNGTASCATGVCNKMCNNGFYMCNGACIANTAQCSGVCGATGYQACGATCILSTACCPPAAAAVHFVDGIGGVDAPDHGGPGACAYKTIGYALARATGQISLAQATYSNEAWPLVLTGSQLLACNPNGTGRATIKMVQPVGSDVIQLTGNQNELTDCIVNCNANNVYGIDITTSGASTSLAQVLSNLDIGDCENGGVIVEPYVLNVRVTNSFIHSASFGIIWDSGSTGQMLTNSFSTNQDVICQDNSPSGPTGTGNTDSSQPANQVSCSHCANCASF
jgi:hypothetical protein